MIQPMATATQNPTTNRIGGVVVILLILLVGIINIPTSIAYEAGWDYTEAANAPLAEDTGLGNTMPPSSQNAPQAHKNPSKQEIRAYALEEAKKAGIWVDKFDFMMEHESHYNPKARGDQKIDEQGNGKCTNKKSPLYGKPANARGLAQITSCWFPEISDKNADNYKFAVRFMIDEILKSKENCRIKYSTCDLFYQVN